MRQEAVHLHPISLLSIPLTPFIIDGLQGEQDALDGQDNIVSCIDALRVGAAQYAITAGKEEVKALGPTAQPVGKRLLRARPSAAAVLLVLQFFGGVASAPVYALLAVYVEQALADTPFYTASLKSLHLAVGGLSAPIAGVIADRLGYRQAYVWGMTSTVAACAVFLTGHPLLLAVLCLYSGLLGSLQTTAGQAYLMETTRQGGLGLASAVYFLGYTLGTALGSAAAGAFVGDGVSAALAAAGPHGESQRFLLLGVVTTGLATALLVGALLLPPLKPSLQGGRGHAELLAARDMLRRREVKLLLAIRFLPTCYWGAVTLLVPLLLFRLTGSSRTAGEYAGASLALAAVCQLLTGRLCDVMGLRLPLMIAPLGITVSAVGLALGAGSVPALWLCGVLGACAAWSLSTTMPMLIDRIAGPGEKGRLVGFTALAWSAGMLFGTLGAGRLATGPLGVHWPGLPFALAALCCCGTMAVAWAIALSEHEDRPVLNDC